MHEPRIDLVRAGRSAAGARRDREPRIDRAIAALARPQHGVVSRAQLLALGVTAGGVDHRVAAGRLHVVHAGVYAVGHLALAPDGRRLAAVLACGPGAALSHLSAAVAWRIAVAGEGGALHVTCTHRRTRPGIRTHQGVLLPGDHRRRSGVPITSPVRTLLDLAATLPTNKLERAIERARVERVIAPRDLPVLLRRAEGRRGARALRATLADRPGLTRSEAERRLSKLVASARLPRPRTNVRLGRHEIDFLWRDERLIVEVDGYRFHSGRAAFERDRRRDAELQAKGLRVVRVTWRMLEDEPEAVVARLAAALAIAR